MATGTMTLTYICHVSYTDPNVGAAIDTETSITYTLVSQATELKSAYITGESAFLYDTNLSLVGSNTITLTANVTNTSISQWQYKKADGTFEAFPLTNNASNNATTLVVSANEANIWLNNNRIAVIKLVTTDNSVYDLHEITKIYDGAAGTATLTAQLSNSAHYVPCDAQGHVTSLTGAATQLYIFEGGLDVTSAWTVQTQLGNGLTGSYDSNTHVFTPATLTDDTSYCDFVCSQSGYSTLTVRYTITKSKMGADGQDAVIYELKTSTLTINKDISGAYTPSTVTFSAWKTVGNTAETAYSGRFKIEESANGGSTYSTVYTSSSNEASKQWTPSAGITIIKATLYAAGGTTNVLDEQTVVITRDGATGQNGADGLNGISMGLGNYQDVIPCKSDGTTAQAKTITIPFYAYAGITRIPVTAAVSGLPANGITVSSNTAGTTSNDGSLVLNVANNSPLGNASTITGDIVVTLSCQYNSQTQSMTHRYTYTKSLQAVDGYNAVILQIYSDDGGIIRNSSGSTTLKIRLVSGAAAVTPTSIVWKKWSSTSSATDKYDAISGATSDSLQVTADMVDDLAFFKVEATYSGTTYNAYYTVDDLVDPYMSYTFATVQEFKNSQGFGAVYTRVYQNGEEIDPIKTMIFSNTPPSSPTTGDLYYHLDTTNKKCTLKKYNGSTWGDVIRDPTSSDSDTLNYAYYRHDSSGDLLDTIYAYNDANNGAQRNNQDRCIYVDPTIIGNRMQFICEVTDRKGVS